MKNDIKNKFQGCFVGGAIGDALGYPIEFLGIKSIQKKLQSFVPFDWNRKDIQRA